MIEPIHQTRVVTMSEPLPPCWLRRAPTIADVDQGREHILRTGPQGKLHQALIETIEAANEVVLVASFLFADRALADALLRASERGRRVYLLTASDERLAKIVGEDDVFEARMIEEHRQLLDRLAGKVLLRSAPHFHAKMLVTDPQTKPAGWLTTANFNKALHDSVELGVRLGAAEATATAGWFSHVFWAEAERELPEKGRLARVREAPGIPALPAERSVVGTTKTQRTLRAEAERLIHGAQTELVIATYGIEGTHPIVEAIGAKARSGVPVTILTRPRPSIRDGALRLAAAGARIVAHDKLHAKAIVSDAGALVMSANLESNGLDAGFELGVVLDFPRIAELRQILTAEWMPRFPWEFAAAVARSGHLGEVCLADKSLRDGRRSIIEERKIVLDPVTAQDALQLNEAPEPALRSTEGMELPRAFRYEWDVRPPHLPKGATQRMKEIEHEEASKSKSKKPKMVKTREPYDPPVYDHAGKVFVVLREGAELERVRKVAAELNAKVVLS